MLVRASRVVSGSDRLDPGFYGSLCLMVSTVVVVGGQASALATGHMPEMMTVSRGVRRSSALSGASSLHLRWG